MCRWPLITSVQYILTSKRVYGGFFRICKEQNLMCWSDSVFWHIMPADDPYEPLTRFILMDYSLHIDTIAMKQSIL